MSVFVDDARSPYGRMLMSHMLADTTDELLEMATTIGLEHRHLQAPGTYREHFDICQAKRARAIAAGAEAVTRRQLATCLGSR